jgi:hypothetical protein
MEWQRKAVGLLGGDWLAGDKLALADPYLTWLDITGYRGAPVGSARVLPTIREMAPDQPLAYKTLSIKLSDKGESSVPALADPKRRGDTKRFEVSTGFVSEDDAQANAGDSKVRLPSGQDGRKASKRRPVVGFIDYGCAFANRKFLTWERGRPSTRILALWDQGHGQARVQSPAGVHPLRWRIPADFRYGAETHREAGGDHWGNDGLPLNDYLAQFARAGQLDEASAYRHSGYAAIQRRDATHGTFVMDLATGYPSPLRHLPEWQASADRSHGADIVFVQLPRRLMGQEVSGLLRANVYDGIRYILNCAHDDQPVVINLSYGGNVGPHDGSSVLECAIDWRLRGAREWPERNVTLVIPSGNARQRAMHAVAKLGCPNKPVVEFEWHNQPDDPSDSFVEIWLPKAGGFDVCVRAPGASAASDWVSAGNAVSLLDARQAGVNGEPAVLASLIYPRQACQSDGGSMVLFAVARTRPSPVRPRAAYGKWRIGIRAKQNNAGEVHAWCERDDPPFGSLGTPRQSYFVKTPTSEVSMDLTLNSIGHGSETMVIGGYVPRVGAAAYSGTGPGRGNQLVGLRQRNRLSDGKRGPEALEISDENAGQPGLMAAAVYGTDTVRLRGTSAAAAVMTRRVIENCFAAPGRQGGKEKGTRKPLAKRRRGEAHPDDELANR